MKKTKKFTGAFLLLFAAIILFQACAKKIMDSATFQVTPSHTLPSSVGLDYKEITLNHNGRKVKAWITEPLKEKDTHSAVILFNGIADNRSKWVYFQKFLADSGITSVSFDYGPEADTLIKNKGTSRLPDITKDVAAIIDTLKQQRGKSLKLFLLAHSVGNAVMLQIYPKLDTSSVTAVIVCNAFSSMTNWGVQNHYIPKFLAFVFPDYYDNVKNVKLVYKPVLVVHSKADQVNLYTDGEAIFRSANLNKQFVQFDKYRHNDIYKKDDVGYWLPIVKFIKIQSKSPELSTPK